MRIAIPIEHNKISSNFEDTREFKIYEAEDEIIVDSWIFVHIKKPKETIYSEFILAHINVIICDYMGMESKTKFATKSVEIITEVTGYADDEVIRYLSGENIGVMDSPPKDTAFTDIIDTGVYRSRRKFKPGGFGNWI